MEKAAGSEQRVPSLSIFGLVSAAAGKEAQENMFSAVPVCKNT